MDDCAQMAFCHGNMKNAVKSIYCRIYHVPVLINVLWFLLSNLLGSPFSTSGYRRQFLSLHQFLSEQPFYDQLEVIGIKDPGMTGNFEVRIGDDKQLIHSKRTAGQGRAESPQERAMLVEFIEEYLGSN